MGAPASGVDLRAIALSIRSTSCRSGQKHPSFLPALTDVDLNAAQVRRDQCVSDGLGVEVAEVKRTFGPGTAALMSSIAWLSSERSAGP